MSDLALSLLATYGGVTLFVTLTFGAIGLPLPSTLLLIATGAFSVQGGPDLYAMSVWAVTGAIIGDQAGYWIGRRADSTIARLTRRKPSLAKQVDAARAFTVRWGGMGVFLTRWLLSPIGPAVNIAAGALGFPWSRFSVWSVLGEAVWVALFLAIGFYVGRGIEQLAALVGDISWAIVAVLAAAVLGWRLVSGRHAPPPPAYDDE